MTRLSISELYKKAQQENPQNFNYSFAKNDVPGSDVFGGLGQYLNAMKPQDTTMDEARRQKIAKYAVWGDLIKTLGEGIGLAVGQGFSNATPNVTQRGVNPIVTQTADYLQKLKDTYQAQNDKYNAAAYAQKLHELNYDQNREAYNRGIDLEQIQDQNAYNARSIEEALRIKMQEEQEKGLNSRAAIQQKRWEYEKNKDRKGVYDPYFQGDPKQAMMYFNEQGQYDAYLKYLAQTHPELFAPVQETTKDQYGAETTKTRPVSMNDIESRMMQMKLSEKDINEIARIAGYNRSYQPQPDMQNAQLYLNRDKEIAKLLNNPQFFDPSQWVNGNTANNNTQNNTQNQDWNKYLRK